MTRLQAIPFSEPLSERLARPPGDATRLYWLGQAGFVIDVGGLRIVIDPYLSDTLAAKYAGSLYPHARIAPPPVNADGLGPVNFVLCTHHHTDHMDPATLAPLAKRLPLLRFLAPAASLELAHQRTGAEPARLVGLDADEEVPLGMGVTVRALRAAHETLERDAEGRYRFLGFVVTAPDARIYHSGDCVPFEGLADDVRAARPDLALLPANGRSAALKQAGFAGNFTIQEAVALGSATGVHNLICHHYGLFAFNTADPAALDAALARAPLHAERARFQIEYLLCP